LLANAYGLSPTTVIDPNTGSAASSQYTGLYVQGGGAVSVTAGGDITNVYTYAQNGPTTLKAGGSATQLSLATATGDITVQASHDAVSKIFAAVLHQQPRGTERGKFARRRQPARHRAWAGYVAGAGFSVLVSSGERQSMIVMPISTLATGIRFGSRPSPATLRVARKYT
jgi:hypothetical protein